MTPFVVYPEEARGEDGYPREWHATIKDAVREEAGHRCVRCGHPYRKGEHGRGEWTPCDERCEHGGPFRIVEPNGEVWMLEESNFDADSLVRYFGEGWRVEAEARWRILTVHHLNGDKLDCRWWNLASLCQRCHLTVQGRVVLARVWPWEHTDWFKPYVAGYYASVYLGEELTREQTLARLDELLALELQVPA